MSNPKITVVCPIYQERRFIEGLLESITLQDYPKDCMEVFLIDGMSKDGTREFITEYAKTHPFFKLIDNPQRTVPYALNNGIAQATGDVIIRIDAHCKYPVDYFSQLVSYLYELKADNVGGVCNTLSANDSTKALAIAQCLCHPFGVGGSDFRIGANKIKQVDTVPFGCFHRSLFDKIGMFDIELTRNQDDEFNGRIIKNGGKIFLIPDIVIEYAARDTIEKTRRMYWQYGLFKPLVNSKLGTPATIRQFFPMLFCIGIVLGALLSFASPIIAYIYLIVMTIYFVICFTVGIKTALHQKRLALTFYMPYIFLNLHLSYGFGYIKGLYKVLTNKKMIVNVNR